VTFAAIMFLLGLAIGLVVGMMVQDALGYRGWYRQ
jgi:hypothetical protein